MKCLSNMYYVLLVFQLVHTFYFSFFFLVAIGRSDLHTKHRKDKDQDIQYNHYDIWR